MPCFFGSRWLFHPHSPVSHWPHRVIELLLVIRGCWSWPFPFWGLGCPRGDRELVGAKVAWRLQEDSEASLLILCRLWVLLLGGALRGGAHNDRDEVFLFYQVAAPSSQLHWDQQRRRGPQADKDSRDIKGKLRAGFPACMWVVS